MASKSPYCGYTYSMKVYAVKKERCDTDLAVWFYNCLLFLACDSMYAIAHYIYAMPVSLPSHGWISQKRLKLGSCSFHRRIAP